MSDKYEIRKYKTKAEFIRTVVALLQLIVAIATLIFVIVKY